jgi:NAD(P)-dependent dehydrogenase (short-subunit alcohol dehydrogenase family)
MTKTLLIVGHSSGIGRAAAERALNAGWNVIGWSRRPSGLNSSGLSEFSVDVLQDGSGFPELPASLDGVLYAPGSINLKPFRGLKISDFQSDFELSALGAVRVLQASEKALKAVPGSAVVLFSTVAVQTGMPFHTSVAMAKGAVEGLTRSLAAEWSPSVRVNALAPSLTDTPLAARLLGSDERRQAGADRHPLKSLGRPEDLASTALFLLSDEARWITGQVWGVDGGMGALRTQG